MMMVPRKNNYGLLDDIFTDSFFGRNDNKLMKTDIKETENNFLIMIDIPGYDKDNIKIEVDNGYLTVTAEESNETSDEEEKFVRKERYFGQCSRSFYVGEHITHEDVKASFKNGTLNINIPKKDNNQQKEKRYVQIEE